MTLTVAEQRARLERMVEASLDPTLSAVEVDDLMALSRIVDVNGTEPDEYADWKAATAYALGAYAVPTTRNGHYYRVTTAGTSHATTQPTFPTTSGSTVTDGTVVWTESGLAPWEPAFDLNRGAAEGWERKARKVANEYAFSQPEGESHHREQKVEHFQKMARTFRRRIVGVVGVSGADNTWPAVSASVA